MAADDWFAKMLRTVFLPQSVSQLEELASGDKSDKLIMQYNPAVQEALHKEMPMPMECSLHFSKSQVTSALDYVRNKTLDWTLELESRGIIGEGLSFGETQKREAEVVTNHIYGGNFGVLGSVAGAVSNGSFVAVSGDVNVAELNNLIAKIREAIPALPVDMRESVEGRLGDIGTELKSAKPSRGKISHAIASMRTILEGAAGNLAASAILAAMANISI